MSRLGLISFSWSRSHSFRWWTVGGGMCRWGPVVWVGMRWVCSRFGIRLSICFWVDPSEFRVHGDFLHPRSLFKFGGGLLEWVETGDGPRRGWLSTLIVATDHCACSTICNKIDFIKSWPSKAMFYSSTLHCGRWLQTRRRKCSVFLLLSARTRLFYI